MTLISDLLDNIDGPNPSWGALKQLLEMAALVESSVEGDLLQKGADGWDAVQFGAIWRGRKESNESLNNTTNLALTFTESVSDQSDGAIEHNASTGETILKKNGRYLFALTLGFASNTSGLRIARIGNNATGSIAFGVARMAPTTVDVNIPCLSRSINRTDITGDISVYCVAWQNSGGSLNVLSQDNTHLTILKI
jgi:hypothetical protein